VRVHTPDSVENEIGDDQGDDQGDAAEEAHENENAELDEQDEKPPTAVDDSRDTEVEDNHDGGNSTGDGRSDSGSAGDDGGHGGTD
jgi:hypothetical protein